MPSLFSSPLWTFPRNRTPTTGLYTNSSIALYVLILVSVAAAFQTEAVQSFMGIGANKALVILAAHAAGMCLQAATRQLWFIWFNLFFAASGPFLGNTYQPMAWVFFIFVVASDAVMYTPSAPHAIAIALIPASVFTLQSAFLRIPGVDSASVWITTGVAVSVYVWTCAALVRHDALAAENEALEAKRLRREERERIIDDLHDGLGATLTGMTLRCRVAEKALLENTELASQTLAEVAELSRQSLQRLRLTLRSLGTEKIRAADFHALLRSVAVEVAHGRKVAIEFDAADELLGPEFCYHLLLMAREALSNAVRHAEASSIEMVFRRWTKAWSLSVSDDGVGFAAESEGDLRSLRRRAGHLDARLSAARRPTGGTTIMIQGEVS